MNACPTQAIVIDPATGAKVVLDQMCIGCHLCTIACPFGTVWTTPGTDKAAKCDHCGGQPACATACPTQAIQYVDGDKSQDWFAGWQQRVHDGYVTALGPES